MNETIYEAIEEFTKTTLVPVGYLLSQRQHSCTGGYIPEKVIVPLLNSDRFLLRDHFCVKPGQLGYIDICYDAQEFNLIHIDPWFHNNYDLAKTKKWFKRFSSINPNILFEIGTEDYIAKLTTEDYQILLDEIKDYHSRIIYLVCQGGSVVFDLRNISPIDVKTTKEFIDLAKKYNFKVKRHNCDFHSLEEIELLKDLGVDAFNYAPEFSCIYNEELYNALSKEEIETLKPILIENAPWQRWIYNTDDISKLFISCLHYIQHPILDQKLKEVEKNIKDKIIGRLTDITCVIY